MSRAFKFVFLIAVMLAGCTDSSDDQAGKEPSEIQPDGSLDDITDDGDGTPIQTEPKCDTHEQLCGGVCTDVTHSVKHCGDCTTVCDADERCSGGKCVSDCPSGTEKCAESCADLMRDTGNCGACGTVCGQHMACTGGACVCEENYFDNDGDATNGCERSIYDTCEPGTTQSCYPYAEETKGVGTCKAGIQRCVTDKFGHYWSTCEGAIGPRDELTCTDEDYNCNGIPDGSEDRDGDGYSICAGDCCDTSEQCGTSTPELIHPGMYEIAGDGFDNNCNGVVDEAESALEPIAYEYGRSDMQTTGRALARAMDINQECESAEKCAYGLYEVSLTYAGSKQTPDSRQVNIMSGMKDASGVNRVLPQKNGSFAVLSSGIALDVFSGNAKDASFFHDLEGNRFSSDFRHEAQVGADMTAADGEVYRVSQYSRVPEVYRAAHGGKLQTHESCPTGKQEPAIFDSVQLHLGLKAPANAKGFSFDFRFFSREYPAYLCSKFNDFFLVLSSSTHEEMSKYPDRNIAFDEHKNPVSVNNGFFTSCDKPTCGSAACPAFMTCSADQFCTFGENTCRDGATAISAYYPEYYSHAFYTDGKGGGTAWLHTTAPVNPGESFSLDFYIWDTGDNRYDSTVLLDNFKWELDDVKVGTDFAVVN